MTLIKPCPFCGDVPPLIKDRDGRYDIKCCNPDCLIIVQLDKLYANKTDAIEAWNARKGKNTCQKR